MSEKLLIQLRDCFTAGYTMPLFCADCGIKRPLFVGISDSQSPFLWEIYVQFMYNRNFTAQFALLNSSSKGINYSTLTNSLPSVQLIDIADTDLGEFDRIIILEPKGTSPGQFEEVVASKNDPTLAKKIIFLDDLLRQCITRTYIATPLLHFMQRHPGVVLINVNSPKLHQSVHNSEHEKFLIDRAVRKRPFNVTQLRPMIEAAQKEGKTIKTPYDFLGYTNQEVYDLLEVTDQKINADGSTSLDDNEFLGIRDGKRLTADQPEHYKNRIYFVGNCVYYGFGVPYDKTVESWLQKFLNEKNLPYRVENESQFTSFQRQDTFYILNKLKPEPGDIIFVALGKTQYVPFLNFRRLLDRPHNYGDVFADAIHINEIGHKILAQRFFDVLLHKNFFEDIRANYVYAPPPVVQRRYGIPRENISVEEKIFQSNELDEYKKKLRAERFVVGSIVMNCNPFTLGHEYLVSYAAARVDRLFIFVVEEDKSDFAFADRFQLVKEGVKKFDNVKVLPSGKFIISQQTFSGYFNKANLQNVAVDSSEDVEIFAREIAPTLGITVRFVGEEPDDTVTHQYNDNMRRILPKYGIDFCEIPRREIGGEVISAKRVREALKIGDFDKIKELVPATTFDFLHDRFKMRKMNGINTDDATVFRCEKTTRGCAPVFSPGRFLRDVL